MQGNTKSRLLRREGRSWTRDTTCAQTECPHQPSHRLSGVFPPSVNGHPSLLCVPNSIWPQQPKEEQRPPGSYLTRLEKSSFLQLSSSSSSSLPPPHIPSGWSDAEGLQWKIFSLAGLTFDPHGFLDTAVGKEWKRDFFFYLSHFFLLTFAELAGHDPLLLQSR